MILYALLGLVIIYLLFYAFIKIKFRFWADQPVFHLYNLFYWIWPCGIIQHGLPPKTKFYEAKVLTKKWQDFSTEKKALLKENGREYAMSCSWKNRAEQWSNMLGLNKNKHTDKHSWVFYCSHRS